MVYTKNYHNLIDFDTYSSFMHHGGNLENNFHWNFVINDGLCSNLALCCEINPHMNDIIILFWFVKAWNIFAILTKGLINTRFNDDLSMKFYTYKKETIKNNMFHQSFQFFLRPCGILIRWFKKCSLVYYGMIMFMIMIFLGWKMFFHGIFTWIECFFNHFTKIKWSFDFFLEWKIVVK